MAGLKNVQKSEVVDKTSQWQFPLNYELNSKHRKDDLWGNCKKTITTKYETFMKENLIKFSSISFSKASEGISGYNNVFWWSRQH